jgi:hypothetical protein
MNHYKKPDGSSTYSNDTQAAHDTNLVFVLSFADVAEHLISRYKFEIWDRDSPKIKYACVVNRIVEINHIIRSH